MLYGPLMMRVLRHNEDSGCSVSMLSCSYTSNLHSGPSGQEK